MDQRIMAASRREAMDWSLVLISQGIEARIEFAETEGWWLEVAPQEQEQALQALEQYRIENRGWPWQMEVPGAVGLFDWGCLAWVMMITVFFWLDRGDALVNAGAMNTTKISQGQWWRLFTAIWLHDGVGHLAANATIGVLLLGLAMGRFGTGTGLLAACLSGVVGNVISWLVASGPQVSLGLGASGMVMGCIGMLAAGTVFARGTRPTRMALRAGAGAVLLFVLLALSPQSDVPAHLGGLIGGFALGALLSVAGRWARQPNVNLLAGATFVLTVIVPWLLALSRG